MIVLFPSSYFNQKKPDDIFLDQHESFKNSGFPTGTVNLEEETLICDLDLLKQGSPVLYRGWMLSIFDYQTLSNLVAKRGGTLFTDIDQYESAHHLPKWYPLINDLTAETLIIPNAQIETIDKRLTDLQWQKYFIKDYVKSLKTSVGSVISDKSSLQKLLSEMKKFRGTIEGGICIRKFVDFLPNSETRYFVLNDQIYSPNDGDIPEIVKTVKSRLKLKFYTVDFAKNKTGMDSIVEIGDGQVSDLVGWSLSKFLGMFLEKK